MKFCEEEKRKERVKERKKAEAEALGRQVDKQTAWHMQVR